MAKALFVYGTLMDDSARRTILKRDVESTSAVLEGYTTSEITIDGEKYPAAVPSGNSKLPGCVIDVTSEDIKKIDEYETSAYKRTSAVLKGGKRCLVYVKNDDVR